MNRSKEHKSSARYRLRIAAMTVVSLALLGLVGVAAWVWSGFYNVSALEQHTAPVYYVLDYALLRSIKHGAESVQKPDMDLDDPQRLRRGLRLYDGYCVQCHGAPGVARGDIGKSMTPVPSNLVNSVRHLSPEEIFWTIKHGIKMTGMPGWDVVLDDAQIWSVTAFVTNMPMLSPAEYRDWLAEVSEANLQPKDGEEAALRTADRGRLALQAYACTSCHTVPGIPTRDVNTGPPLEDIADRRYIAGVLPNTFENLVTWIRDPQAVDPLTAMPDLDVSEADAAAMAVYLYRQAGRPVTTDDNSNGSDKRAR